MCQKEKRRRDSVEESFGSAYMGKSAGLLLLLTHNTLCVQVYGSQKHIPASEKKVKADEREEMRGGRADGFL